MKTTLIREFVSDKYNLLLMGQIFFIVLYPLAAAIDTSFPVGNTLFLVVIVPGLWAVIPSPLFLYPVFLAMISFGLHILVSLGFLSGPIEQHIEILRLILNITFCLIIIVCLIRNISLRQTITADIVKGGISVEWHFHKP